MELTNVEPKRQKLMLVRGKLPVRVLVSKDVLCAYICITLLTCVLPFVNVGGSYCAVNTSAEGQSDISDDGYERVYLLRAFKTESSAVLSTPFNAFVNCSLAQTGTPEAKVIKKPEVMPEVLNDLEEDYTPDDDSFASMAQNQKSLRQAIDNVLDIIQIRLWEWCPSTNQNH
jgi:hypothetical protein